MARSYTDTVYHNRRIISSPGSHPNVHLRERLASWSSAKRPLPSSYFLLLYMLLAYETSFVLYSYLLFDWRRVG